MVTINVFRQYYKADGKHGGVSRKGALVTLVSDSSAGTICYTAGVTFFPHRDDEDFAVSYDACFEKVLYEGKGRRSKKREGEFLLGLRETIDKISKDSGCQVLWDEPLGAATMG